MTTKQSVQCPMISKYIIGLVAVTLVIIAISSVAHTTLALKENSEGNSDVIRTQCLNGLNKVAWETGVCTLDDLTQFDGVINIFTTQGRKAALEACKANLISPGCKGVCVAALNCYDWNQ